MQFIENSIAGVRAAFLKFRSREAQCTYTLLPMIHIGEQSFYDEVLRELERHDLILYESADHSLAKGLTRDYDKVAASRRIKLVTQRAALTGATQLQGKWVHLDASAEDLSNWWRALPLWQRILIRPVRWGVFFWLRHFGDRMTLASRLTTADLRTSQEILDHEDGPSIDWLISEQRDKSIVARLEKFHATVADKPLSIAILFGAAHSRAIVHHLMSRHHYQVFESRWATVFGWQTPP